MFLESKGRPGGGRPFMRLLGNYQSGVRMKTMLVVVFLLLSHGRAFAQVGLLCDFNSVDTLDAVVQSDSVNISNVRLCAYCSATFAVSVTQSSDSLFIVQTDTAGVIATCQCLFDINVAITGLAPGAYSALVYREYLKNYGYQADTVLYVGAVQFTVACPRCRVCLLLQSKANVNLPGLLSSSRIFRADFHCHKVSPIPSTQ